MFRVRYALVMRLSLMITYINLLLNEPNKLPKQLVAHIFTNMIFFHTLSVCDYW